jgi:hypothetical protein
LYGLFHPGTSGMSFLILRREHGAVYPLGVVIDWLGSRGVGSGRRTGVVRNRFGRRWNTGTGCLPAQHKYPGVNATVVSIRASGIPGHGAAGASQSQKPRFVCGSVGHIWASRAKPPSCSGVSDEIK